MAANRVLRREAARAAEELGLPLFVPPIALSTDNAAMIGAAGFVNLRQGARARAGTSTPSPTCRSAEPRSYKRSDPAFTKNRLQCLTSRGAQAYL